MLGIAPNVPGFLKSAHVLSGPENFFDQIYVYAWFTGFFLAGGLYYFGTKLLAPKAGGRVAVGLLLAGLGLALSAGSYALSGPGGSYPPVTADYPFGRSPGPRP